MKLKYKLFSAVAVVCFMLAATGVAHSQAGQFEINNKSYANSDYIVDRDGDGYFIAVWTDARDAKWFGDTFSINEEYAVYGRIFDPSLNPVGPDFRISDLYENGTVAFSGLDLLVLEDGSFVVTWIKVMPSLSGSRERSVMKAMYDRDENVLIPEKAIDESGSESNTQFNPTISRIPGDQYLITWQEGANESRIRKGQRFEIETGEPVGENVELEFPVVSSIYQQFYVDEERFLIVSNVRFLYYFDHELKKVGEMVDLRASLELDDAKSLERLHPINQDTLLIPLLTDLGGRLWFRLTDLQGKPLTDSIQITDNEPLQPHGDLNLAIDPADGSFMLIWTDRRNSNPVPLSFRVADIYAQRFDANGDHIGTNFKVNHEPREENQTNPSIFNLEAGKFFATWWEFRKILCPTLEMPVVSGQDYDEFYLTARTVDFYDPKPGPVYGWNSYIRERHRKCSDVSESKLFYNYPNPFNERTTLKVDLLTEDPIRVDIQIFDVLGRLVWKNSFEGLTEGSWLFNVNMAGLPSGTYFARMTSPQLPEFNDTTKLLLIR